MSPLNSRGETLVSEPLPLLDSKGRLTKPGYALSPLWAYDRNAITAAKHRIKEWDYYLVNDGKYALAFTLNDMSYLGMLSASLLDLETGTYVTTTELTAFPMGKFGMPFSSEQGVSSHETKRVSMRFSVEAQAGRDAGEADVAGDVGGAACAGGAGGLGHFDRKNYRQLEVVFRRFEGDDCLVARIWLDQSPRDSMVIATPWTQDEQAFYYNRKIIGMRAQGVMAKGPEADARRAVEEAAPWAADEQAASAGAGSGSAEGLGGDAGLMVHRFNPEDSFGLLDWGRGVWTRDNTWYWSAAQGWQERDGKPCRFGFNLGYGFGDTSAASENMVFVDGCAHKLGRVDFGIPEVVGADASAKRLSQRYDFMKPWHVTDDESRLDLEFVPLVDRCDLTDVKLVLTDQHQVFGTFSGHVILDDGTKLQVKDLKGFAEAVHNVY